MTEEKFCGVEVVLSRMKTHPEEFFESSAKSRWGFIYKDYFRDSMTESEKGRIHEALKGVRRMEFDALVVKELMKEEEYFTTQENKHKHMVITPSQKALMGGVLTTTSGSNGTSWTNSAITSSNVQENYK
jgi:hypothetical protein